MRLGALPGPGKRHSIAARLQFEHGCLLSHLTFRFLQVIHDLVLYPVVPLAPFIGGVILFPFTDRGSLGEALFFWFVELICVSNGDVLLSMGEREKSSSCEDIVDLTVVSMMSLRRRSRWPMLNCRNQLQRGTL